MKYLVTALLILVLLIGFPGCTRKWAERALVGSYHLINPSGCRDDIRDSTLVIRDDGTFDQHVVLIKGQDESIQDGRWSYDRRERKITFSKFLASSETSFSTEPSRPAMVFVNRGGNCWYQHPK